MGESVLATDVENVLQANSRFYQVLSALDLEGLEEIWLKEDWVRCVHPGWTELESWEAVKESWKHIFENTQVLQITIFEAFVHVEGDLGWVSCVEKVSSTGEGRIDLGYVQATNLFVRRGERWLMVLHHASHLPPSLQAGEQETVH